MERMLGLALALCAIAMGALAESVPSRTVSDLVHFTVTAENQTLGEELFLRPLSEKETKDYQEHLDICREEIEKLAVSESTEAYFGEVINMTDMSGEPVTLKELMDQNELNVFEFCSLVAGGFHEECGKVTVDMLFSTPYGKDERVVVMIGIVNVDEHEDEEETRTVEWRAFEGVGLEVEDIEAEDADLVQMEPDTGIEYADHIQTEPDTGIEYAGRIQAELDPETVHAIQNGTALLAIVSG